MTRQRIPIAVVVLLAMAITGCLGPVSIQTEPSRGVVCLQARVGGWLAADAQWGLGVRWEKDGPVHGVVWPFGYSARRELNGIVLIDASGRPVAREGDRILSGGFASDDGVSHPCGGIEVVE